MPNISSITIHFHFKLNCLSIKNICWRPFWLHIAGFVCSLIKFITFGNTTYLSKQLSNLILIQWFPYPLSFKINTFCIKLLILIDGWEIKIKDGGNVAKFCGKIYSLVPRQNAKMATVFNFFSSFSLFRGFCVFIRGEVWNFVLISHINYAFLAINFIEKVSWKSELWFKAMNLSLYAKYYIEKSGCINAS